MSIKKLKKNRKKSRRILKALIHSVENKVALDHQVRILLRIKMSQKKNFKAIQCSSQFKTVNK
jgi:DNA-binding transcriptional regulator/RsmH inhibitor MraZ